MLAKETIGARAFGGALVWGVLAFAIAGFGALLAIDRSRHYKFVDEVGDLAGWRGKQLQIHGWVANGSIVEIGDQRTFVLQKGGKRIRVRDRGQRSDCLRDGNELVVDARIGDSDVVDARDLKCKCGGLSREPPRLESKFY